MQRSSPDPDLDEYIHTFLSSLKPPPHSRHELIAIIQASPVKSGASYRRAVIAQRAKELLDLGQLAITFPRPNSSACCSCPCFCNGGRGVGGGGGGSGLGGGGLGSRPSTVLPPLLPIPEGRHHRYQHHGNTAGAAAAGASRRSTSISTTISDPKSQASGSSFLSTITSSSGGATGSLSEGSFNSLTSSLTLPYDLQTLILRPLLENLEESCFRFAAHHLPHILSERGWECGASAPFSEWIVALALDADGAVDGLEPVMESVQISRCKLTSHAIVRGLETAEALAVKLGDGKLRIKVQKLRDCVVEAVTEVGRVADEARRREERELEDLRREMERRMFEIESRREEGIRMAVQGRVGNLRAAVDQWAEGRPYGGRLSTTQRGGSRKEEGEADWEEESGEDEDDDDDDEDEDDEEDEDMEEEFYDLEDRMEDDELYEDQRDAMR